MALESILGLPTFKAFNDSGATRTSHRRRILHTYPNGGTPLTGILSMIDTESVESVEHTWYEKRYKTPKVDVRGTNPITSSAPTDGDADSGSAMSAGSKATTDAHYIKVANTDDIVKGKIIQLSTNSVQYIVEAVTVGVADDSEKGYIKCYPVRSYTYATSDATDAIVLVITSAFGEGSGGDAVNSTAIKQPYSIKNQTTITRTSMEFSGTVLQQGLEYDKSGPYKEKARDTLLEHMVGLELNVLFGKRYTRTQTALDGSGRTETVRGVSGIIEFLELWDAGTTGLQIDGQTYAPYQCHAAVTGDDDDNARVIANASGTMSRKKWKTYAERVGRYHTNKSSSKLVLCGSGALMTMSDMFDKESSFQVKYGESAYGLDFDTLQTPFGKFHFTTHPIFNENPLWRNWMLILDVHSIKFRPLTARDTKLLKNRQNNGDDFRKDEFLTEYLIELWHPENNMLIKNVTTYAAS